MAGHFEQDRPDGQDRRRLRRQLQRSRQPRRFVHSQQRLPTALAWARLDYAASDATDIYFEGGQDWTLFGSTALPNILETTALGYWYGDIYERSPQFQFGLVQKLGSSSRNFKISPTFAIMMPSTGQIEKLGILGLQGQIGQGEREGADSGRPEFEGRLALQFQLDKAPAVAPAQIFWSGFRSRDEEIVTNSAYAITGGVCTGSALVCSYQAAFPNGFNVSSKMYGNQLGVQLPTRWFTLVASAYFGGDLRFFFGGQVNTFFTDVGGLNNPVTFTPVDGVVNASGTPQLACTVAVTAATACPDGQCRGCPGAADPRLWRIHQSRIAALALVQRESERPQRRLAALFRPGQGPGRAQRPVQPKCRGSFAAADGQDGGGYPLLQT